MESGKNNAPELISQGIETLIGRLKEQGVKAGRDEAAQLIREAQEKANKIVSDAQNKANKITQEGRDLILREKNAAEEALQLAARNMRIELRQNLIDRFTQEVKRLVHKELDNEAMVRQLILLIGAQSAQQLDAFHAQHIELELPEQVLDFNEIRKNPDLLQADPLKPLVQSLTRSMLKEGMSISPHAHSEAGIKVRLLNEEIVLDVTEEAVSQLLVKHMQPRFRALLEGLLQ